MHLVVMICSVKNSYLTQATWFSITIGMAYLSYAFPLVLPQCKQALIQLETAKMTSLVLRMMSSPGIGRTLKDETFFILFLNCFYHYNSFHEG